MHQEEGRTDWVQPPEERPERRNHQEQDRRVEDRNRQLVDHLAEDRNRPDFREEARSRPARAERPAVVVLP